MIYYNQGKGNGPEQDSRKARRNTMTYREFNEAWLNSGSAMANSVKKRDLNCPYMDNLIYAPTTIIEHCAGTIDIKPEITRNWDDEIIDIDKAYLTMKCRPNFIKSLNW